MFVHLGGNLEESETWTQDQWKLAEWCCYFTASILQSHVEGAEAGLLLLLGRTEAEWDEKELEETVKQPGGKRYDNDLVWSELLCADLHNFTLLGCVQELPPIDFITSLWGEVDCRLKTVPLWLNLSFQLILDIRHSLKGHLKRGFSELRDAGAKYTSQIQRYFQYRRTIRGVQEAWHKPNDPKILKLVGVVNRAINKDLLLDMLRARGKQIPDDLGAILRPFFLLENHPFMCGMLVYYLQQSYRDFTFSFVGCHRAVLSTAHVHNALLIRGLVDRWEDMEYLFETQGAERFFLTERPTAPEDVLKRYQLAVGISTRAFAKSRRKGGKADKLPQSTVDQATRIKPRWHPVHSIFTRHFQPSQPGDRYDLSAGTLSDVISAVLRTHPDSTAAKSWKRQLAEAGGLSERQVLELIRVSLEDDESRFDLTG
jgi:hypothetical protein